jgi:nitrous oxide reductase accessory protein NosL
MTTPRRSLVLAIFLGLLLAGCQSTPTHVPAPPPQPQMVSAAALALDDTCEVDGAVLIEYTVLQSGETANVAIESAPECARRALTAWVSSYRYTPQSADLSARFEWILVSAKRRS